MKILLNKRQYKIIKESGGNTRKVGKLGNFDIPSFDKISDFTDWLYKNETKFIGALSEVTNDAQSKFQTMRNLFTMVDNGKIKVGELINGIPVENYITAQGGLRDEFIRLGKTKKINFKILPKVKNWDEFTERFNQNIELCNQIIKNNNKSGVPYRVTGISERGTDVRILTFETLPNDKGVPVGKQTWKITINPWGDDIQVGSSKHNYAGIQITNSGKGVFSDEVNRQGSGAYKSINEYLSELNLGTVQAGKTTTSDEAEAVWKNYLEKGMAVKNELGNITMLPVK